MKLTGIWNRMVWNDVKPKPLVTSPPKAPIPEDGTARNLHHQSGRSTQTGSSHEHQAPHPRLGVDERLADLVPLPLGGLGARVVRPETLDGDSLFAGVEESRRFDIIGHHPHKDRSEHNGDAAEEDEDALVGLDLVVDVSDTKSKQWAEL
jgi:hypothetical protein